MSGFKDKLQVFSLGLMLGLLIGGGFFILKLDNYFSTLSSVNDKADVKDISTSALPEKNLTQKTKVYKASNSNSIEQPDSSASKESTGEQLAVSMVDSIVVDSSSFVTGTDNIVVRKDELLSARNIEMVNLGAGKNGKDSVLSQLSGIREENSKGSYKVEFWQSPINYKGYKMAKNKILLYGINAGDALRLFKIDDNIYLKQAVNAYRLDFTSEFRQFEKVSDENILARLK